MPESPSPIPGYESARVLRRLGSGPVSDSWLLGHEGGALVLRRDRPCAARIGLDREREFRVLQVAHGAGVGPEPLRVDVAEGLLLTRFVPGGAWQDREASGDPETWAGMGALLRTVHALAPRSVSRFDPGRVFHDYARAAGNSESVALARELTIIAQDLYCDAPWVLCHHDAHLGNVVGAPGVLIDWEYAALGHPLFDLAGTIEHHGLAGDAFEAFVTGWACLLYTSDAADDLQPV